MLPPPLTDPCALTLPWIRLLPVSAFRMMLPPLGPLAVITLVELVVRSWVASRKILPFWPTTAVLALMVPLLPTMPPKIEILLAINWPRLTAWPAGAFNWTEISGLAVSIRVTLLPAASRIWPLGALISPEFSTTGATINISPPLAALMVP